MEYWDSKGQVYNDKQAVLSPLERAYNLYLSKFGDIKNEDLVMGAISMAVPMAKVKYLPEIIAAARLLHHKPFEKMSEIEQKAYRKAGTKYYKNYIKDKIVHNDVIGDVDFKGGQAGEPDFQYMEQYPKLRENIKNATENIFLPPKYEREDATGFDNLKVHWRCKDYDYQIRHNPFLKTPDFYNIKPYDLLIEELKKGTP
jgi:hypothetical protein